MIDYSVQEWQALNGHYKSQGNEHPKRYGYSK